MRMRIAVVFLVTVVSAGLISAAAQAAPILSGGLNSSAACLSSEPAGSCLANTVFTLDPQATVPAGGGIVFGATTVDITLTGLDYSMTGASGSVEQIDFANVSYSVSGIAVSYSTLAPGVVQVLADPGSTLGAVTGTYEQLDGVGGTVVPAGIFSDNSISFTNFQCLLSNGTGQCGFTVGDVRSTGAFSLDVDGTSHDLIQNFNVVVPEPGTFALLGLGLLGLARRKSLPS